MTEMAVANAGKGKNSWPVRVTRVRDMEYEISARGTSYQIVVFPRACGVLVSIPNWNRCGYINYSGVVTARDVMEYLDMGNQVDAASIAAGLNEILRADVLHSPEVKAFMEQRRALIEKLRMGVV